MSSIKETWKDNLSSLILNAIFQPTGMVFRANSNYTIDINKSYVI